jgi:hypothetical protein
MEARDTVTAAGDEKKNRITGGPPIAALPFKKPENSAGGHRPESTPGDLP